MRLKFSLGSLLCLLFSVTANAQVVSVANLRQNVVFTGIPNLLRIIMEGVPCTSLSVSVENGKITKTGACEYDLIPAQDGMVQIVVRGGKKTYNYLLRAEPLPQLQAYIGMRTGGMLSRSELTAQRGISVRLPNIDVKTGFKVATYSYQIIRNEKTIHGRRVKGPGFGRDMQEQFSQLGKNDIVIFYDIVAEDDKGNTKMVPPLQFIIN